MHSCIGVLTYRRQHALQTMLAGVQKHCPQYDLMISEDCGQRDNTEAWLKQGRIANAVPQLMSTEWQINDPLEANVPNARVFLGDCNLGVAGNSNRLLKLFLDGNYDHLCLCNDDLLVTGNFVDAYARAHADLGVGMFCFSDFSYDESYKYTVYPLRGWNVKLLRRFTGIMMSVTREFVEKVGYFDASFGAFGEEHCDWTIRMRLAGAIRLNDQDMNCLDVDTGMLAHQEVETSVKGWERKCADAEASKVMAEASAGYTNTHYYRPFMLKLPRYAGGYRNTGIPVKRLFACGYQLVVDHA